MIMFDDIKIEKALNVFIYWYYCLIQFIEKMKIIILKCS